MQKNPFDIPGMGLNQDNPLFSSLTMMGKMWENMAQHPMNLSSPDPKELDKRIGELKAVENWLRLNLSMLSSTIQGLEIQRSTVSTLQQFAQQGFTGLSAAEKANPFVASPTTEQSEGEAASDTPTNDALQQAGQAWWELMQQQFDSLAQATAQSMQQAQDVAETMSATMTTPSADTTLRKKSPASKKTAKAKTVKTAAKAAKKTAKKATKKTTPKQ